MSAGGDLSAAVRAGIEPTVGVSAGDRGEPGAGSLAVSDPPARRAVGAVGPPPARRTLSAVGAPARRTLSVPARSRRSLLAGAAGATALALAGCGSKPLREKIRDGAHVAPGDLGPLNALLDVEHYAIAAYAAAIPLLGPAAARAGKQFLAQELAHAVELSDLVHRAGGRPHKPPASYNLGHPRDQAQALALLQHVEDVQLGAYLERLPDLSGGHVRATLVTIYANEAQHLAVLRMAAGETPTSGALVAG